MSSRGSIDNKNGNGSVDDTKNEKKGTDEDSTLARRGGLVKNISARFKSLQHRSSSMDSDIATSKSASSSLPAPKNFSTKTLGGGTTGTATATAGPSISPFTSEIELSLSTETTTTTTSKARRDKQLLNRSSHSYMSFSSEENSEASEATSSSFLVAGATAATNQRERLKSNNPQQQQKQQQQQQSTSNYSQTAKSFSTPGTSALKPSWKKPSSSSNSVESKEKQRNELDDRNVEEAYDLETSRKKSLKSSQAPILQSKYSTLSSVSEISRRSNGNEEVDIGASYRSTDEEEDYDDGDYDDGDDDDNNNNTNESSTKDKKKKNNINSAFTGISSSSGKKKPSWMKQHSKKKEKKSNKSSDDTASMQSSLSKKSSSSTTKAKSLFKKKTSDDNSSVTSSPSKAARRSSSKSIFKKSSSDDNSSIPSSPSKKRGGKSKSLFKKKSKKKVKDSKKDKHNNSDDDADDDDHDDHDEDEEENNHDVDDNEEEDDDEEEEEASGKSPSTANLSPASTFNNSLGTRRRKIVSLDIDPNDENWKWRLFPEPAYIKYTPEFDHIADQAYESRHDIRKPPEPERRPGVSGYDFEKILAEEDHEPPAPTILSGVFGDYMAERRRLIQWQARLASRGKMCLRIQCLVRRFLARLVYLELVRQREMERKRQRIKELKIELDELNKARKAEMKALNIEFERRRIKERESFFENYKVSGRQEMLTTRRMVAMKPQLHRQSKKLKAEREAIRTEKSKLSIQIKTVEAEAAERQKEASEYEKLLRLETRKLAEQEYLCLIESTLKRVYEKGLDRLVASIEKAASDDVDLVESVKDLAKLCAETLKILMDCHHNLFAMVLENQLVASIEKAASNDVELLESVKDLDKFCSKTLKVDSYPHL